MSNNSFLNMAQEDRSEESMLIEQADITMAHPNLVDFVVGDSSGKRGRALTIRVWIVGIILSVVMSFLSQLMMMRTVPIMVSSLIQIIIAYPMGNLCAAILPKKPIKFFKYTFNLNPGPFSLREHALIFLLTNGGNSPSVGLVTEVVRGTLFKQEHSAIAGLLSGLASVLVGVALGGLISNIVVWPEEMTWPQSLMFVSLTKALHERRYFPSASRIKFFWTIVGLAFIYQFIPGLLFTSLSSLSFLCWMKPSSPTLNQIGSGLKGLGVGAISLDWSLIASYMPSPLIYPFYAAANLFAGFVIFMWILVPAGYYNNTWDSQRYPIQSFNLYDKEGLPYKTEAVHKSGVLNEAAYKELGPIRMTWMFFNTYFVSIAAVSAAITHVALYHGLDLADHALSWYRTLRGEFKPPKLGRRKTFELEYPKVPLKWYGILLIISFVLGLASIEITQAKESVHWYMILVAILVACLLIFPLAWIAGMTSHLINIHILSELIAGVFWPGNGAANMYFRSYSYFTVFVAVNFCVDLKFGQYMKLPPRQVLLVKIIGIVITAGIQSFVTYTMLKGVPNMCEPTNPIWGCTYFHGLKPSVFIWGIVGPIKLFATNSIYHPMVYSLLVGFILPIPFYLLHLKFPDSWFTYINIPIILSGSVFAPAAPTSQYFSWFLVAFIFNHLVYKLRQSWWLRKNLLLSAGLDTGTVLAGIIIGLALTNGDFRPEWWGNRPDGGCPLAELPLNPTKSMLSYMAAVMGAKKQ